MSCHSSGSLEGGCPSSVEVIEDTEDFIQFDGLYSLFSAVERFLYLRDFLMYEQKIGALRQILIAPAEGLLASLAKIFTFI